jgi:serine protease Do
VDGGVVVEQVSGAAEKAGVQPGDMIVSVNRVAIDSPAALRDAIARAQGKRVALLVQRDDAKIFIPVTIG